MTRGPKPMPSNMRLVTGSTGKRPLPEDEPKVAVSMPAVPDYLDPVAKAEWPNIVGLLFAMQVMTEADVTALALYCDAFSRWRRATDQVNTTGMVVTTVSGNLIQHPYQAAANKAHDQMLKLLVEFGLTPSSRTRVRTASGKTPWQDL